MNEEVFTVLEIAKQWKLSPDTIQRWFAPEPGVMVIERDTQKRYGKRAAKQTLRIPVSVRDRVWRRKSNLAASANCP
jgi:hypothetical protein